MTEERLKKTWATVDAQTCQKEDVKRETVHCLDDDNETEVPKEEIIQGEINNDWTQTLRSSCSLNLIYFYFYFLGFRYGSDIVPFSKVDQDQMKYKHDGKCFAVLGFTKQNMVFYLCAESGIQVKLCKCC